MGIIVLLTETQWFYISAPGNIMVFIKSLKRMIKKIALMLEFKSNCVKPKIPW